MTRAKRIAVFPRRDGLQARLTCYAPRLHQPPHDHDAAHLSIVLAGDCDEDATGEERRFGSGMIIPRCAGMRHSVRFGSSGALVLTLDGPGLPGAGMASRPAAPPKERHALISRLLPALRHRDEALLEDLLWDAVACADDRPGGGDGAIPLWLRQARDAMVERPAATPIAALAGAAGVHPVHFSRMFHRAFGARPSLFRRRCMVSRAIAALVSGHATLSGAALEAGFADQSHMNRAVLEQCGLPPGRLHRLFQSPEV